MEQRQPLRPATDPAARPAGDEIGRLLVAARHDVDAFAPLYVLLHGPVLGWFRRRTACPHTAAELTDETFVQALASLARFDPERGTGRGWVFGIAGNLYRRWLRTGRVRDDACRRLAASVPDAWEDDVGRVDDRVDGVALRGSLATALAGLPPATRAAVVMRVVDESPYADIAARLRCTEGNARVRVARGLGRLGATVGDPPGRRPPAVRHAV